MKHHPKYSLSQRFLTDFPGNKELLTKYINNENHNANVWLNTEYKTNPQNPELLIQETKSGIKVRSKSEAIIASVLFENDIPFRYECELILRDTIIYPDFTILNPKTGEIIYWEHFGMFDNTSYYQKAINRLMLYASNKIYPTINLIVTYETSKYPLSIKSVENIVDEYFN